MIYKERVPEWALCYIINGDKEGLNDEEIKMVDDWLERARIKILAPPADNEESYFDPRPPFGLGCNVYDCDVIYKEDPLDRNGKPIEPFSKVRWYDPDIENRDIERVWKIHKITDEIIYLFTYDKGYSELEAPPSELEVIE